METLARWIEHNIEFSKEEKYYYLRVGAWSIGAGEGIFGRLALHLEMPLALIAFEI